MKKLPFVRVLLFNTLFAGSVLASDHPSREQMDAVFDCAKGQGVTLPAPSHDGPPNLTDEQKQVADACFKQLGIEPPPPPPPSPEED